MRPGQVLTSRKHLISSMIAELISEFNLYDRNSLGSYVPKDTFARPCCETGGIRNREYHRIKWNARFPRIQSRESFFFHSSKVLPCVNHIEVPSWCVLQAILSFVEGFGGESQVRSFSRVWFPVDSFQPRRERIAVLGNDERLSSSVAILGQNRDID